jgi:ABC-type glycerol-3-phosphate transport system permease component
MDFWHYIWKWLSNSFSVPIRATEIVVLFLTIAGYFISQRTPKWENAMKSMFWIIPLVVLVLVLIGSLVYSAYDIHKDDQEIITKQSIDLTSLRTALKQEYATPDMLIPLNLKDLQINVADLVRSDIVVRNKTFENCYLYGPAIITPTGDYTTFSKNYFDAPADSIFITISEDRFVSGAIGFENCQFIGCHFVKIGIIGNSDLKQKFIETSPTDE